MKAKYLLRGLGLGIIITAVVMGAYTRSAVADARVAVLKEYGIGEEAALAETLVDVEGSESNEDENAISTSGEEAVKESAAEEGAEETAVPKNEEPEAKLSSAPDAAEAQEQVGQEAALDDSAENQQEGLEAAGTAVSSQDGTVTIEISRGDDSGTVARKLYNAGLVENAADYDAFLMQHGYDKKLSTGLKIINATDSWSEIADKLTKK